MALTYKNRSTDTILNKLRDIRYGSSEMLFSMNNFVTVTLNFSIDINQLMNEADVFCRTMLSYRSIIDFKRILGSHQEDWGRQLNEAFIYDRLRAIYYGLNAKNIDKMLEGKYSFPGHILLYRFLAENTYTFSTSDTQPYNMYVNIKHKDVLDIFEPVFEKYNDLRDGLSLDSRYISYVNTSCEMVLTGLYASVTYMNTRSRNLPSLFEIKDMTDSTIHAITASRNANPICNSFLSSDGKKFYFINPVSDSGPGKMRFNESLFIMRALGFTADQLVIDDNNFYTVSTRDSVSDPLTKDDVYSITGVKSDLVPYSYEMIMTYLGINNYKAKSNGGNSTTTPSA